ncbi:hypothetical protein OAE03_01520 [Winogradskyella sp.]|nr:hypothetical protein [Winogradskyella sp.]MDC0009217.1 hypothetical protein [Winogradskyella sp.]
MKGYKFTTEEAAQSAIASINLAAGLPKSPEATTRTWTNYNLAELNIPQFYYINHDEFTESVLGIAEELNVIYAND